MGNSKLTLIGMYNWDSSILDNFSAPTEFSADDIETLKMNLLSEVGEFEVLYSDFDFLKAMIGFWSKKNKPVWDHLYETTQYEYNPIHNYDRTELRNSTETRDLERSDDETRALTWQDKRTANLNNSSTETRNLASSGTDSGTIEVEAEVDKTSSGSSNTTRSGRAFNDSDLVSKESEVVSTSGTENTDSSSTETRDLSTSGTETGTVGIVGSEGGTDTHDGKDQGTIQRSGTDSGTIEWDEDVRISGNIGVMSTQNMIQQERDIALFNLMDYIINDFKHAFCIMKY